MYLLDTNVISETRRIKPHGSVMAWLADVADEDINLAAITIGEIQAGIEITRDNDAKRARELEQWLGDVAATINVLPMNAETFRIWAKLMHRSADHLLGDAMLAACAKQHNLTIVTRNTKDFAKFGVRLFNPFLKT